MGSRQGSGEARELDLDGGSALGSVARAKSAAVLAQDPIHDGHAQPRTAGPP